MGVEWGVWRRGVLALLEDTFEVYVCDQYIKQHEP